MGVAVKNPSATASFGVPKTSPWRGSVGGGFEYEEKGDFATSTKHFRYFMRKLKKVKKSNGQSIFFAVEKWFLLNSPPGEIQFVAKDVKEAASEASSRIL
ncbi:unnamed protein product [Prunus brigantina]